MTAILAALLAAAVVPGRAGSFAPACGGTFGPDDAEECSFVYTGNPVEVSGTARGITVPNNVDAEAFVWVRVIGPSGLVVECQSQPGTGLRVAGCANAGVATGIAAGTPLTCRTLGYFNGAFACASGAAP